MAAALRRAGPGQAPLASPAALPLILPASDLLPGVHHPLVNIHQDDVAEGLRLEGPDDLEHLARGHCGVDLSSAGAQAGNGEALAAEFVGGLEGRAGGQSDILGWDGPSPPGWEPGPWPPSRYRTLPPA